MPGPEAKVERKVCHDALHKLRVPNSKLSAGQGDSDRVFWVPCKPLLIEFKAVGKEPSAIQAYKHEMFRGLGYDVHVCHTYEEAFALISKAVDAAKNPKAGPKVLSRTRRSRAAV